MQSLGTHLLPQGLLFAFNPFKKLQLLHRCYAHRQLVADATTQILTGATIKTLHKCSPQADFHRSILEKEVSLLKPPECIKPV